MTLVFLHGWGSAPREWEAVRSTLPFASFAPSLDIAPDDGTPSAMVARVEAAVTGFARYVLVGHSMGGKVAQRLAAQRPPGLSGLVLVAPSPLSPEPMTDAQRTETRAAFGNAGAIRGIAASVAQLPLADEARTEVVEDYLRTSKGLWDDWLDVGSRLDLSSWTRHLAVPTLVVAGGADPVMALPMLRREVVGRIAGARLETVEGSGHLVPREAPELLAQLIAGFVSESARS